MRGSTTQRRGLGFLIFFLDEGIPLYQFRLSVISISFTPVCFLAGRFTHFNIPIMSPVWTPYFVCVLLLNIGILGLWLIGFFQIGLPIETGYDRGVSKINGWRIVPPHVPVFGSTTPSLTGMFRYSRTP